MVTIHRKSNFMLVTAHSQLGEAYLNLKWFEQSLEHLTRALKLNANLLNEVEETKDYHTHLLTMLGRCYLEAGNYKDSRALLEKSLAMNKQVNGEDSLTSCPALQLLSKLGVKEKQFDSAFALLEKVTEIYEKTHSDQIGFISAEMAKIARKQERLDKAVALQTKALAQFELLDKYKGTEVIAELLCTLSQWQEAQSNVDESLMNLQKASEIYEAMYGLEDKETVRVKRNIALVLLRGNQFQEALRELFEVEQLEYVVFGESSVNLAKTMKVIGTLLIISGNRFKAKEYLMQAHSIFESRGMIK
jgi:tetratricopeptide (TPR) repeat protein